MEPSSRLVLIRHGQSNAQVGHLVSTQHSCTGLSDEGRRQAQALRDRLLRTGELAGATWLYTSVVPRAIETAEIISPALDGVAVTPEIEWQEIDPGEADGLTTQETDERYPPVGAAGDPYGSRVPGAESWAEFFVRAGARLRRVWHDHPAEFVVCVSHAGVVGASFVALGDMPVQAGMDMMDEVRNTSITEWRCRAGRWTLVRFNDYAHLF